MKIFKTLKFFYNQYSQLYFWTERKKERRKKERKKVRKKE